MPKSVREMLRNGNSYDETDRIPRNITITNLDIILYVVAIVGHLVDLGLDINIAVRYYLLGKVAQFGWTLIFILLPAFVNTAVSIRMYAQDKQKNSLRNELDNQQESLTNQFTKRKYLRVFILVLQMAPILRFCDALIYSIKSRQAERKGDVDGQRKYYQLMLDEDADAALLRIFECFLEAAPQQVLQMSLLFYQHDQLKYHQMLSIISSVVSLGWCLASYQRAIRFPQPDKLNMNWTGSVLQTFWHFLVTLSRIVSLSIIAYLDPHWTILACACHIVVMSTFLQIYDRSPFCSPKNLGQEQNCLHKLAEIAFSFALGGVYLFEYILPIESRTRYRYIAFYSLCFIQNCICGCLWFFYVGEDIRNSMFFYPILVCSVVPFCIGICFMVVYYAFFHPKVRWGNDHVDISDANVNYKDESVTISKL